MAYTRRCILIHVVSPILSKEAGLAELDELKSLVATYQGATVVRVIQRRNTPDPATYIGSGKMKEVQSIIQNERIDTVIFNGIINPAQLFRIEKIFWSVNPTISVWDRVDLILHIFEKHAHTAEAKLQIELAGMRHMGPRMYGLGGTVLSRQGGGIGARGLGETNVELMKRHWKKSIQTIEKKLKNMVGIREQQIYRRKALGLPTVSIIGYTNAGKTTLFNVLTGKHKLAENILFATLDTSVGKMLLPAFHKPILVSDTIGFIKNLPPELIEAFTSTLITSIHADLLIHVADISDVHVHENIEVVENIIRTLKLEATPLILVFNKADKMKGILNKKECAELYARYTPLFISAVNGDGIPDLLKKIEKRFQD